jgi:hypothetical protein
MAQMAPGGFTAAINSPVADVLEAGTASAALTNSNPEKRRAYPDIGGFGSVNLGFGLLPGLEVVGRLAFDGDQQCNAYAQSPPCRSWTRDLSAGAKYQLPLRLIGDTRLALGATDLGGAATNFRSYYGVATSSLGALDLSLGYGRGSHPYSTLKGVFGSSQVFLTERWRLLADYDSRELRAGVRYARALGDSLDLELGASRKLTHRSEQQVWQTSAGLSFHFDRHALTAGGNRGFFGARSPLPTAPTVAATTTSLVNTLPAARPAVLPAAPPEASPGSPALGQRAEQLATRLRQQGFSSIAVGFDDDQGWVVQAEPLAWRKNRLDALGVALAAWQKSAHTGERLRLVLSYLQDPVLGASTSAACLANFAAGDNGCNGGPALALDQGETARPPQQGWTLAPASAWEALHPQLELGVALHQRVGTEYGLYDYALGLDLGWELPLARGLLWQGQATALPLAHSGDFEANAVFGRDRIQNRLDTSTLSYQVRLAPRLWSQASVGYVQHHDHGGQVDVAWLSPEGRWRLGGMGGYYQGSSTRGFALDTIKHPTALASVRWSAIEGRWHLETQVGQFYNQDRGFRLASHHWFGDNRLTLQYRNTEALQPYALPRTRFAGFELSIPFGPKAATPLGSATVRGRDQWTYGVETKVGGTDNNITSGYGIVSALRHGLMTDTLDNDRAGLADMAANLYRVRAMLREMAQLP